jgi:hypothetical protein
MTHGSQKTKKKSGSVIIFISFHNGSVEIGHSTRGGRHQYFPPTFCIDLLVQPWHSKDEELRINVPLGRQGD